MEKILLLFTSPPYGRIQEVVDAGVVPRLYELLDHPEDQVVSKALQTINNIVSGSTPSSYSNLAAGGWCYSSFTLFYYYFLLQIYHFVPYEFYNLFISCAI